MTQCFLLSPIGLARGRRAKPIGERTLFVVRFSRGGGLTALPRAIGLSLLQSSEKQHGTRPVRRPGLVRLRVGANKVVKVRLREKFTPGNRRDCAGEIPVWGATEGE